MSTLFLLSPGAFVILFKIAPSKLLKHPSRNPHPSSPTRQTQPGEVFQLSSSVLSTLASSLHPSTAVGSAWKPGNGAVVLPGVAKAGGVMVLPEKRSVINLAEKIQPLSYAALQQPEEQTDNWDDDFEDGISFTKLQGMPQSER